MILQHLDKNNLHHAYLIEGIKEDILPEIFEFIESIGVKTSGNPDFSNIILDSFKIENAKNLKYMGMQKSFSNNKKFFIISVNSFLDQAQDALLKLFEEPIENTHFFLIVPDINILHSTILSRFYLIRTKNNFENEFIQAKKFISLPLSQRILFIKELIIDTEEEEDLISDSVRTKCLKFLNALEFVLHEKFLQNTKSFALEKKDFFSQIFKAREYLRQPGSSTKSLMESVAINVPNY